MKFRQSVAALAVAMVISTGAAHAQIGSIGADGAFSGAGCLSAELGATFAACTVANGAQEFMQNLLTERGDDQLFFSSVRYNATLSAALTAGVQASPPDAISLPDIPDATPGVVAPPVVVDVPEPGTHVLLLLSLLGLTLVARRRRSA